MIADLRFDELETIHARIESDQSAFLARLAGKEARLACPAGCGCCCLGFMPDLTGTEAAYMASYLLDMVPDIDNPEDIEGLALRLGKKEPGSPVKGSCPFHDSSRRGQNCLIYPARPLICRLFGFSAMRDKWGEPTFTLCRHMPSPLGEYEEQLRGVSGRASSWFTDSGIPVMSDYAPATPASNHGDDRPGKLLDEILPEQIHRLALQRKYLACADDLAS